MAVPAGPPARRSRPAAAMPMSHECGKGIPMRTEAAPWRTQEGSRAMPAS